MSIHIRWLGHSAFALNVNGARVLIDPFLTGNPLAPVEADQLEADFILLTHAHADHVAIRSPSPSARAPRSSACGRFTLGCRITAFRTPIRKIPAAAICIPLVTSKFVRADHSSSFPDGSYGGVACGIVLSVGETRLYFAGDTALFSDMRLIGDMGIHFAALPIGDNFTMGPSESIEATRLIRPQSAFPVHYNTFPVIQQDVVSWAQHIHTQTDAKAIVVDPGGSFSL